MKKIISFALCLVLVLSVFSACKGGEDKSDIKYDPILDGYSEVNVDAFPECVTDLGLKLITKADNGKSNVLVSPLSAYFALAMVSEGASGETLSELEVPLGMENNNVTAAISLYLKEILSEERETALSIANALWLRSGKDGAKPTSRFIDIMERNYMATVFRSPMNSDTVYKMNSWVKEKTSNRIKKVIEKTDPEAYAYIVNAISFDSKWEEQYKVTDVRDGIFTDSEGREQKVKFMSSTEKDYIETDLGIGFKKAYEGERYSFIAIMPKEEYSISELLASLDSETLCRVIRESNGQSVMTMLPKFTVNGELDLAKSLKELGVNKAFEMGDGFSELSPDGQMCLSRIIHKTYVKVYEEGTEAGAVTVIEAPGSAYGAEPKTVYLDRPFVYGIVDVESGIPVLLGTMNHVE